VPRRAALAALAVIVGVVAGCGGSSTPKPAAPSRTQATTPALTTPAPPPPLVLGVTERNPHLLAPGDAPARFALWRDRLAALHLRYLRVLVDWAKVQPRPGAPPDWTLADDGCLRGRPPCAPFAGIHAELQAAHAAGLDVVFVFLDTPAWAASPPSGCERPGTPPGARMPADLGAYRSLVGSLAAEARADGIATAWWSAWNEPNHPAFLSPQRATCDRSAPSVAADSYARLVSAMRAELAKVPGGERVVLGETAAISRPSPHATGAREFAAALPAEVVCGTGVWAQHAYVEAPGPLGNVAERGAPGSEPLLHAVERGLASHGCPGPPPQLWITETGVAPKTGARGCRAMADALRTWADDPRVDAAFQYTFRDDSAFEVGLADPSLHELHPAYAAWRAWAQGTPPASAPCAT